MTAPTLIATYQLQSDTGNRQLGPIYPQSVIRWPRTRSLLLVRQKNFQLREQCDGCFDLLVASSVLNSYLVSDHISPPTSAEFSRLEYLSNR